MATNAFFISETYLKENSPLNLNVDMSEIYPFAKSAEDVYIQDAIGTCLYDDLKDKIIASKASPPTTMSDEDILLCKKIRSALVWLTVWDALPFIWIKIRNIGPVKQNGDNLETIGKDDLSYLRNICKQKADFYVDQLKCFLCENQADYPEYYCTNWDCSKLMPNENKSSRLGLVLRTEGRTKEQEIYRKYFRIT